METCTAGRWLPLADTRPPGEERPDSRTALCAASVGRATLPRPDPPGPARQRAHHILRVRCLACLVGPAERKGGSDHRVNLAPDVAISRRGGAGRGRAILTALPGSGLGTSLGALPGQSPVRAGPCATTPAAQHPPPPKPRAASAVALRGSEPLRALAALGPFAQSHPISQSAAGLMRDIRRGGRGGAGRRRVLGPQGAGRAGPAGRAGLSSPSHRKPCLRYLIPTASARPRRAKRFKLGALGALLGRSLGAPPHLNPLALGALGALGDRTARSPRASGAYVWGGAGTSGGLRGLRPSLLGDRAAQRYTAAPSSQPKPWLQPETLLSQALAVSSPRRVAPFLIAPQAARPARRGGRNRQSEGGRSVLYSRTSAGLS